MMELQGKFLIAMPHLDDYFNRTVVFMCEHNEQGSMGLVINQPTDLSIAELYSKLNFMMKNDRTFILHKNTPNEFQHTYKITDDLSMTTSADVIETLGSELAPEKYLIALGCSSWEAGQLEKEITDNAWLVATANDQILFDMPYDERYVAANQLLGIHPHNFVFAQVGHS